MENSHTRREFLQKVEQFTTAAALGGALAAEPLDASRPSLLRRKLGRTGIEVSVIGIGLGPLGIARYSAGELRSAVQAALDGGVNYFDTQPDYGDTERYLAPIARRHRQGMFIVTKTGERSRDGVLACIRGSLDRLGLDTVDAVLLNNIGKYEMNEIFGNDGALAGLKEARRRGQVRFFGVSGHYRAEHFARVLRSGEFDIAMAPFNLVDRFTYSFEQEILPVAAEHGVGVVAMKTLGGAVGLKYDSHEQTAMLPADHHELAIRYALGLAGMCTAVIGCKSAFEVVRSADLGRRYRPLRNAEFASAEALGRRLATQWGRHYPEG